MTRFPAAPACRSRFDHAFARRLAFEPIRLARLRRRSCTAVPDRDPARGFGRPHHRNLVVRGESHEVARAHNVDRCAGGAPHRRLVERRQPRPGPWTTQHPRMEYIVGREIVDEGRAPELVRKIEPRQASPHDAIRRRRLGCRLAACRPRQVDLAGHGPVVLPDIAAGPQEPAVLDGERCEWTGQPIRDLPQEERPYLRADQANCAARYGDRIAARGEAFRRARRRLSRDDAQPLGRDVELLGRDLRQRGEDALTDLDLAGGKPHAARLLEADPGREQGIVDQALGQRGHGRGPIMAPARATARMMRLCAPQRQRCRSRAAAISLRLGRGLRASRAAADINMPERQ